MKTLKEFVEARIPKAGFHGTMEFIRKIGITWPTYDLAMSDPERSRPATRELIAEALRFVDWSDLQSAWEDDDVRRGLPRLAFPPRRERPGAKAGTEFRSADANVEPFSELPAYQIPEFDLSVAAGQWVEVAEIAEVYDGRQIDHGRFRIRIRGDSMLPKYEDGCWIEFRCLRTGRDVVDVGSAYYVQRSDGTATFKIVDQLNDDQIVLRALNKRKYPGPMPVARTEIVRMAKAEWVLARA